MSKKIIIFPFGGNARESLMSILAINQRKKTWDIIGFFDDNPLTWGKNCCGFKVNGGREVLKHFSQAYILAVPGNPGNYLERKNIIGSLKIDESRLVTILHPTVSVSGDARIGFNTLIMSNTVISCGVKIGNHCIILPNTVVAHDTSIGDYSIIGANVTISGNVRIDSECYVGSGVNIRENLCIGKNTLLGLGSNVVCDIEENVVAVGNPARLLRGPR